MYTKKQVQSLLKVISKDKYREAITCGYVDVFNGELSLFGTDGYHLTVMKLGVEGVDADRHPLKGRLIRREAIERWVKLATGKSRLNVDEVAKISNDDYGLHGSYVEAKYPNVLNILEGLNGSTVPMGRVMFNANLMKNIQDVHGDASVKVEFYGEIAPMLIKSETVTSVVMPMRIN